MSMLDVTEAVSGAIPYGMVAGRAVSTVGHYSSSLIIIIIIFVYL